MARAITRIERRVSTRAEQDLQAVGEVVGAIAQHKDALLQAIDILGEMHKAGLLDVAQGMLKNRQELAVIGINQLNKSGAQRFIKNGMGLVQFLGELDPERLKQVMGAMAHGLESALDERQPTRPAGMWGMLKTLRDPDVNTSLGVMMNFLRGMGEGLPHSPH